MRIEKHHLILISIILFFVSMDFIWFRMNQVPPWWDQAQYLRDSLNLYDKLTNEGVRSFYNAFTDTGKTKAPLISVVPIPFYLLFGKTYISALSANLLFIILGSYYFYKFGALISTKRDALLGVFILNLFPLILGMSREFLVEYGLMTLVVASLYYFLKSDCFENRKYSLVLGILIGLGMLMKVSFPVYVIAPMLFLCIKKIIKLKKLPGVYIANALLALVVGVLLAGTWYFKNFAHVINFAYAAGYGEMAENYRMGNVFELKTILGYWLVIINSGISTYMFLLIICLIAIWIIAFLSKRSPHALQKEHWYFLIIWFAVPFMVFTFGVNKDYRYVAPALPPIALLMSVGLNNNPFIKYKKFILAILLIFPVFNYFFISFSSAPVRLETKHFIFLNNQLGYAHPPIKEKWPNEKLIEFIRLDAMSIGLSPHSVSTMLLCDHQYINVNTQNYYSKKNGEGIYFATTNFYLKESIPELADKIQNTANYLVTKSVLGPEFSNVKNIALVAVLKKGKLNFEKIGTLPLPDGTSLSVHRNKDMKAVGCQILDELPHDIAQPLEVNFGGKVVYLGTTMEKRTENQWNISYYWQLQNDLGKYKQIFVHFTDKENNPLFQNDHEFCANRSFAELKGKFIKDTHWVGIPQSAKGKEINIKIGLYAPEENGSRLKVESAGKALTDEYNTRALVDRISP
jgi:4-amino-4-deoxy-L-arabinose transferase-like glycosyltransferase